MANVGRGQIQVVSPQMNRPTQVKALVVHPMHSGDATDPKTGKKIPPYYVKKVYAEYNGKLVFEADWSVSVSRNPYIAFYIVPDAAGTVKITWVDNKGDSYSAEAKVKV